MTVNGGGEGIKLIVVDAIFLAFSCVAVALRLYARAARKRSLQLNDWLILIALVCQIGQSVLQDLNGAFGDIAVLPTPGPTPGTSPAGSWTNTLNFPGAILWGLPLLFIKLSVLHWYYVVFPTRKFRWLCISMMILVLTYFVAYTVVVVLSCIPVSMDWDPSVQGSCIDLQLRMQVTAGLNLGIDVLVVLLPMPVIPRLALSGNKWLMVCGVIILGLCVCVVSGLRIYYLDQTDVDSQVNYYITTLLEPDLGTIVACLPLLWPIVKGCVSSHRSGSPDSEQTDTDVIRWSPDPSTLLDDEEMAKRVQHADKTKQSKARARDEAVANRCQNEERTTTHSKPQARDEGMASRFQYEEKTPLVKPQARDEGMASRFQHEERTPLVKPQARDEGTANRSRFEEKTSPVKQQARDERPVSRPRAAPTTESQSPPRSADRPGDRNSKDRPISRILMGLSSSRPLSWRKRSDWPLSDDVERELSGKNSARVSRTSDIRHSTERPSFEPSLDEAPKISEDTIRAAIVSSQRNAQRDELLYRSSSQKDKDRSEPPPRNPDRLTGVENSESGLGRKDSAAQRLTTAAATLDNRASARTPPLRLRTERSEALGGDSEDASRWESRSPLSPLKSPIGRSPALTPPPKRGSPALQPGIVPGGPVPPIPNSKPAALPRRSKSAKERSSKERSRKETAPAGNPVPSSSRLTVDKQGPLVSNPDVLTPGAPPSPGNQPRVEQRTSNDERRVRRDMTKSMSHLDATGNRESFSAELDSEWGRELLRSVAAVTRKETDWL